MVRPRIREKPALIDGVSDIDVASVADVGVVALKARRALGLTQADAAGLLGVGVRFLAELERGKPTLEMGKVLRVLQGLGLSLKLVR